MGFGLGKIGNFMTGNVPGMLGDLMGGGDDPGKAQLRQALAQLGLAEKASQLGYARADAQLARSIPLIRDSYKKTRGNVVSLANQSKAAVTQGLPSALSNAAMDLGKTGYDAGTLGVLAERGVRGDLSRALSTIDNLVTQNLSSLDTSEAGALDSIYSRRAANLGQGAESLASIYGKKADTIAGVQHVPKKTAWDLLGSGVGLATSIKGLFA